jgi:hypothetical protein
MEGSTVKIGDALRAFFGRREPPISTGELPGVDDFIAAIFVSDCQRQEMEQATVTQFTDSLNIGTVNGISIITFNHRRK